MKTAMQELLEYLQKDYDGLEKQKTEVSKVFKIAIATVMKNIEDLYISKEKEQIINACHSGGVMQRREGDLTPEEYYSKTFKSDE